MFKRLPLERETTLEENNENENSDFQRIYGLSSLLAVGIGGAVGSGLFVLSGTISNSMAGPATPISWLLGGAVCSLTALSYAELSCIVPSSGSTFSFAYHGLGEIFAVLGAWCVTLEFGVASAAVSRSWGDKVAFYASELGLLGCSLSQQDQPTCWLNGLYGSSFSIAGGFLSALTTAGLLCGVEFGKTVVNILVVLKLSLVLFVIIVGFAHFDKANLEYSIPPSSTPSTDSNNNSTEDFIGGIKGIFVGSLAAIFGFIGFDEVTSLTLEAKNHERTIPLAIIGTIISVTIIYIFGALALVGMVPYTLIDKKEGFGSAFRQVNAPWAMHITLLGQLLVVLPAVVLVSFLPQCRLIAAVARKKLLPQVLGRTNSRGNLVAAIAFSGVFTTAIALLVPFHDLNNLISGGALVAFNLSNASLLVLRTGNDNRALSLTGLYTLSAFALSFAIVNGNTWLIVLLPIVPVLLCMAFLASITTPPISSNSFAVSFMPFAPCLAFIINCVLFLQLPPEGLLKIGIFVFVVLLCYTCYRGYRIVKGSNAKIMDSLGLRGPKAERDLVRTCSFDSTSREADRAVELCEK